MIVIVVMQNICVFSKACSHIAWCFDNKSVLLLPKTLLHSASVRTRMTTRYRDCRNAFSSLESDWWQLISSAFCLKASRSHLKMIFVKGSMRLAKTSNMKWTFEAEGCSNSFPQTQACWNTCGCLCITVGNREELSLWISAFGSRICHACQDWLSNQPRLKMLAAWTHDSRYNDCPFSCTMIGSAHLASRGTDGPSSDWAGVNAWVIDVVADAAGEGKPTGLLLSWPPRFLTCASSCLMRWLVGFAG